MVFFFVVIGGFFIVVVVVGIFWWVGVFCEGDVSGWMGEVCECGGVVVVGGRGCGV